MKNKPSLSNHSFGGSARHWLALPAAFVATVLALPVNAGVEIPTDPLTSEKRLPPNIVFILDDSSSMGLVAMPAAVRELGDANSRYISGRTNLGDNPTDRSYTINTIYYDPSTTYQPWINADGSRYTAGMAVDKVFTSLDMARGTGSSVGACGTAAVNPNQEKICDLRGSINSVFYVPNVGKGYTKGSTNAVHYDRYSISSSGVMVVDGSLRPVASPALGGTYSSTSSSIVVTVSITVTSGMTPLKVFTSGGTNPSNVQLDVINPSGGTVCTSNSGSNGETCTISNPVAGTWKATLKRDGSNSGRNFSNVTLDATVTTYPQVPSTRDQAAELANYATWYSYYRTRIKTAKGGASESFATLGRNYRIGYTSINSVNKADNIIPIDTTSKGEFFGSNKSTFFTNLQGDSSGSGQSTPLRGALNTVGQYFMEKRTDGPWGPGTGNEQFGCRQNFSILTTDGYWSSGATSGIGNEDGGAGRPYADTSSDTLADIAYKYWVTDLRSDMADNVPTSEDDGNNSKQHMNTFTVSIGVEGNLKLTDLPALKAGTKSWPSLASNNNNENADKIDDLWHAAINGRGDFVVANNPAEFTTALSAALATINGRTSSYSNVASNSVSLDTGAKVFNASYTSGSWVGALTAREVSDAGVGSALWSATFPATRTIKTKADGSNTLTNFPTPSQTTALGSTDIINYLKGDQTKEKSKGGDFRDRSTVLGDIVGSSPAYVKGGSDGDGTTDGTLYVGANDGMLHAFNAKDGKEIFAYVPTGLNWEDLKSLSDPKYSHRFFVDGPIVVSTRSQTQNKNILIGALGKGGKGLYALNVTTPASPAFMWELKETSLGNMGLVMGKPILGKVGGKASLILGNGMNSSHDRAVLIIVKDIDGATQSVEEIDTGAGDSTTPNGLSAPVAVYGKDGKTLEYAYAGDMLGNVWKFDLAAKKADKLFTATNDSGTPQPISGGLTVATDPRTNKRWIFFGTGRYLIAGDADPKNNTPQSMYGIIDNGDKPVVEIKRNELTSRTMSVTSGTVSGYPVRAFEKKAALPSGSKGWYVNLPASGERIVQDAQVVSTFLITASMIPNSGTDPCKPDGSGYINALDAFTGTSAGGSYFDLDGNKDTDDTVGGFPVGSVDMKNGMPTLPNLLRGLLVVGGTGGAGLSSPKTLRPRWDRVSWREVRTD